MLLQVVSANNTHAKQLLIYKTRNAIQTMSRYSSATERPTFATWLTWYGLIVGIGTSFPGAFKSLCRRSNQAAWAQWNGQPRYESAWNVPVRIDLFRPLSQSRKALSIAKGFTVSHRKQRESYNRAAASVASSLRNIDESFTNHKWWTPRPRNGAPISFLGRSSAIL